MHILVAVCKLMQRQFCPLFRRYTRIEHQNFDSSPALSLRKLLRCVSCHLITLGLKPIFSCRQSYHVKVVTFVRDLIITNLCRGLNCPCYLSV
uniref:Uncharacterized protein n=1 Tax=Triticum urartu TaxID=4572 RepID=A0A8R7PU20_TRIUA